MSKERARRREAREREAAARAAERAAQARRRERRRALLAPVVVPVRRARLALRTGRPTGVLAERRRMRIRMILALLMFAQLVVWVVRDDWGARLGALVLAVFVFPVALVFAL